MLYKDFHAAGYRVFLLLGRYDSDGEPLDEKAAFKKPRGS